jgi:S-adenosylmethionine synthetase
MEKNQHLSLDIGVIQDSVIGPLLFSMYINDTTQIGLNCETILCADDTTFIFSHKNLAKLEKVVIKLSKYDYIHGMAIRKQVSCKL